jgi:hypothetical protein
MQIRTKLAVAVLGVAFVVAVGLGLIIRAASEQNIRKNAEAAVAAAAATFAATERAEIDKLSVALHAILADPRFQAALERRDRAALQALAKPLFDDLRAGHGISHWYFHLPDRTVFLRVHAPELFGDEVKRATMLRAAATGEVATGKELGATAFALRAVAPWSAGGKRIGFVELAEETDGYLHRMKALTSDDYSLFVEKRHLDRAELAAMQKRKGGSDRWDQHPALVLIDSTMDDAHPMAPALPLDALPDGGTYLGEVAVGSRTVAQGVLPVTDATGHRVGALVVHDDITRMHDSMTQARLRVILLVGAIAILAAGLLVVAVNVLVFSRLARMTLTLEEVGARLVGGDYDVARAVPPASAQDEIGHFEDFFGRFIAVVAETLDGLTKRRR